MDPSIRIDFQNAWWWAQLIGNLLIAPALLALFKNYTITKRNMQEIHKLNNGGFDEKLRDRIHGLRNELQSAIKDAIAHRDKHMEQFNDRLVFIERHIMNREGVHGRSAD